MKASYSVYVLMIIVMGLLAACSCSSHGDPAALPSPDDHQAVVSTQGSHSCWGVWQFAADPANEVLDVIQLRTGNLHLNAIIFLEPPPMVYLTLESLEFNGNIIEADIGLRHPFYGLGEFSRFDVCGILISNSSVTGFTDSGLRMPGPGDTRLLNPDGYSRW